MTIDFDQIEHKYTVDGVEFPSVTKVLSDMQLRKSGPWEQGYHRARGHAIHKGCCYVEEGVWDPAQTDERILPYIMAYQRWLHAEGKGFRSELREQPVASARFNVAGTLDLWGHRDDGKRVLIDLKRGANRNDKAWSHAFIQTALYGALLEESQGLGTDERIVLVLMDDGKYCPFSRNGGTNDLQLGLSAVTLWWHKKNHGLL